MSKITIERALLEQAIEALSYCEPDCEENTHGFDLWANVLPPLREALAQPQPVQQDRVAELEAANAELLESLVDLVCLYPLDSTDAIITSARAAIKKHGGAA